MAKKEKKSNIKTSFTNTKNEKITVLKTGEKFRNGVSEGGQVTTRKVDGKDVQYRGIIGKNSGSSRQVRVGSGADKDYDEEGLYSGKGQEEAKYSSKNKPRMYEPTVITDTTVREDVIPEVNEKINRMSETGQYYDPQGNLHNADGSIADNNAEAGGEGGYTDPRQSEVDELIGSANEDNRMVYDTLDSLSKQTDQNTAQEIRAIKASYKVYEQQLEEVNRREQLDENTSLLLGGSSRYTSSASGISAGFVRAGIMELAELDAKEMSAIAEAKSAQAEKKWQIASKKLEHVETLRKEKLAKASEISKLIAADNQKLREQMQKQTVQGAIVGLFQQGITDVGTIADMLNYHEDGSPTGGFIDLKDIEATLKIINPGDDLKGTTTDYQTFKKMQENGEIPEKWDYFDFKTAVKNSTTTPGSEGGFTATEKRKLEQAGLLNGDRQAQLDFLYGDEGNGNVVDLAPEDERALIGAGYTSADVNDIEDAINEFGIDAVLEDADSEEKKDAIRKVFGMTSKVTLDDIENMVTQKVAYDGMVDTYTPDELIEIARDNGYARWFSSKGSIKDGSAEAGTELAEFLNSDDAVRLYKDILIEQYRNAGMYQE